VTTEGRGLGRPVGGSAAEPSKSAGRPSLDIVIVNWNTGQYLRRCLQSIATADHATFTLGTVVVVDNASTDRSLAAAEAAPDVTVLANDRNRGFAAACNQGARVGRADRILFLNPDTELAHDTLTALFACIGSTADRGVGVYGAQMVNRAGHRESSCSRFPTPWMTLAEVMGLSRVAPRLFPRHHMSPAETAAGGVVDQVIGAFFVVSRELFEQLDGFDERFFLYCDDVDFAYRAHAIGKVCYLCADARVYHEGGVSSSRMPALRLYNFLRSRTQFARKHWHRWQSAVLVALTIGIEIPARLAIGVVRKEVGETARGSLLYIRYVLAPHSSPAGIDGSAAADEARSRRLDAAQ
jgi:N-acetylglucosaminyl-diphospho-decaprenol L-rhamnosyltransferase